MPSDHIIVDEIRARLSNDLRIHNAPEVAVGERAQTVTLRGTVRSPHQRRTAVEIAGSVPGVRKVVDELVIDPRDHWQDDQVRGAALQALMATYGDAAPRVDVRVSAGWLTLRGNVRRQSDSDAAFAAVSAIPGVGGITNEIRVVTAGVDG